MEKKILYHNIIEYNSGKSYSSKLPGLLMTLIGILFIINAFQSTTDSGEPMNNVTYGLLAQGILIIVIGIVLLLVRRFGFKNEGNYLVATVALCLLIALPFTAPSLMFGSFIQLYELDITDEWTLLGVTLGLTLLSVFSAGLAYYSLSDRRKITLLISYILALIVSVIYVMFYAKYLMENYEVLSSDDSQYILLALYVSLLLFHILILKQVLWDGMPFRMFRIWSYGITEKNVVSIDVMRKGQIAAAGSFALVGSALIIWILTEILPDVSGNLLMYIQITMACCIALLIFSVIGPLVNRKIKGARIMFIFGPIMLLLFGVISLTDVLYYINTEDILFPSYFSSFPIFYFEYMSDYLLLMPDDMFEMFKNIAIFTSVTMMVSAVGLIVLKRFADVFRIVGGLSLLYPIIGFTPYFYLFAIIVPSGTSDIREYFQFIGPFLLYIAAILLAFAIVGGCDKRRYAYEKGKTVLYDGFPAEDGAVLQENDTEQEKVSENIAEEDVEQSDKTLEQEAE